MDIIWSTRLFLSVLQHLLRSWPCWWRVVGSLVTELCVRSRALRCQMSNGSALMSHWRVPWSGLLLRAPAIHTTVWASWEMWSQASSTPAVPLTHWVKSSPPFMCLPHKLNSMRPGPHLFSCSSCLSLWVQRSFSWLGWGCGWFREELCMASGAVGNNLLSNDVHVDTLSFIQPMTTWRLLVVT